jgi:hypothetical protein
MSPAFFTSALDGSEWSTSRPGCFTPCERAPVTHWIGCWVGLRAGLGHTAVNRSIDQNVPEMELCGPPEGT